MKVVGIHGIAHTRLTAPEIKVKWLPALQGGLEEAGCPRIAEEDFAIASYGSLFRPSGTRSGDVPKLTADYVTDEWEQALLLDWWQEAAALSELNRIKKDPLGEDLTIQGPDFEGRGRTPDIVQRALRQLTKSRYFEKLGGERVVLFALKQVREYLYNLEMKAAIQKRVVKEVTEDTRIIIGHSLGSVIAYECLCAHPEWNVRTLVTLGSPLGISLVFNALTPAPVAGKGVLPNVKEWFNIADRGAIVALEKELARRFGLVVDQMVDNGWESHSALHYLNEQTTGQAIATGL